MNFEKYQHVERFGTSEVRGIELGTCYVFPKIDRTNSSCWLDNKELKCGSRKRELTLEKDNGGFYNSMISNQNVIGYLHKHPTHRLYGEWLIPHSLKTYRDEAWRKFYVFDVCEYDEDSFRYLTYDEYKPLLEEFNIDYVPCLKIIKNGNFEDFIKCTTENTFLIKDGFGVGEGIVIKNYDYKNQWGRIVWAKIVTNEFKEKHIKKMGSPVLVKEKNLIEQDIIDKYVTESFVNKEYEKIKLENNGWSSKCIPILLSKIYYELINEEMWHIIKKFKSPKIDFKILNNLCIKKIKEIKSDLF